MTSIRHYLNLIESALTAAPTLYHGTCPENAASLVQNGWAPRAGGQGANMGQTRYLYLTTDPEDALWFAQEKGCNSVVEVRNVPMGHLIVDPEDGAWETLGDELAGRNGLPGKVALTKPLPATHFRIHGGGRLTEHTGGFDDDFDRDDPQHVREAARRTIAQVKAYAKRAGVRAEFRERPFGHDAEIELTDLYANKPGGGAGTKVMTLLARLCDQYGLNLYAKPESQRNIGFYARFGFERCSRHFGMLVRFPPLDLDESAKRPTSVAAVAEAPRFKLPAGTTLYHGTESRKDFKRPRGPAWFTLSQERAAQWSGWRASDPDKGTRRVLAFRVKRDLDLFDTRRAVDYYNLAAEFDPDNEPEDASPWTVAQNLRGADGWYDDNEVMLRSSSSLELIGNEPVRGTVKSFGNP